MGLVTSEPAAAGLDSSTYPREYTQEEKIAIAISRLAENEQLLGALAWRLGIPLENVRRGGREPPLARVSDYGANGAKTDACGKGRDGVINGNYSDKDEDEEEMLENREQVEVGC